MQISNRASRPTAIQIQTQLLCAMAVAALVFWSQPSHAGSLLLWGWLGVADIQIMQSNCGSAAKQSAVPVKSVAEKTPAVEPAKTRLQTGDVIRSKETKAL